MIDNTFLNIMSTVTVTEIARFLDFKAFSVEPELPLFVTHIIVKVPRPEPPGFSYECRPRSEAMRSAARIVLQCNHAQLIR